MEDEDIQSWRTHYRQTLTEESTPALDELILRTATRHATRVRIARRSALLLAVAAVASVAFWPYRSDHEIQGPRETQVTEYGREEGATRYYLLNVDAAPYTGPGTLEQTP